MGRLNTSVNLTRSNSTSEAVYVSRGKTFILKSGAFALIRGRVLGRGNKKAVMAAITASRTVCSVTRRCGKRIVTATIKSLLMTHGLGSASNLFKKRRGKNLVFPGFICKESTTLAITGVLRVVTGRGGALSRLITRLPICCSSGVGARYTSSLGRRVVSGVTTRIGRAASCRLSAASNIGVFGSNN